MARNTLPEAVLKTPIPVFMGQAVVSTARAWLNWLSNVAVTVQTSHVIDFGNTAAQSSTTEVLTMVGARKGDKVLVAAYPEAALAGLFYTADVTDKDEITVRCNNYSSGAINPPESTFVLYRFSQ